MSKVVEQTPQEELLKAMCDQLPVVVCVIQDGRICHLNSALPSAIGYTHDELLGKAAEELVFPEDRDMVRESAIKMLKGQLRSPYQFRMMRKDGSTLWVIGTVKSIQYGGRRAVLGAYMEITERKQMEEKLRELQEEYRLLFESSPDCISLIDKDGRRLAANPATARSLGIPLEELIGKTLFEVVPPEVAQRRFQKLQEALDKWQPLVFEDERAGRYFHHTVVPVKTAQGKEAVQVITRDITEQKRMEQALRHSEERYRALFHSMVIGTFVLDAETMRVVMANEAAAKTFGFGSIDEVVGIDPLDFVRRQDRKTVFETVTKELFEHDLRRVYELRAVTKDGRQIWLSITGARVIHEGKLGALLSFVDITEQKRQTERLMMTDRLASLGELAAGAAHELNNPLTSIVGLSQLLLDRRLPDSVRVDIELIHSEAQRAAKVTKNLLTFARKHAPVRELAQINDIVEDVLRLRAYEHKTNAIEVRKQLDPNLPEIMVDYFQMQQVFLNIIINAEYFMIQTHNRGTLTITTEKQGDTVVISFTDDGPGIPPENLGHIFDPFFTTKETGEGTGLGLSICHGIVSEHGGQIYARSELGKGATFVVELPINGIQRNPDKV